MSFGIESTILYMVIAHHYKFVLFVALALFPVLVITRLFNIKL